MQASTVKLYPNPATEHLFIQAYDDPGDVTVEIYTVSGRLAARFQQVHNRINVSELDPGLYIVAIKSRRGTETQKITIH